MNSQLHSNIVLVLNRNWQAINIVSPAGALSQMCTDVATGLDIRGKEHMVPTKWDDWMELPVREGDAGIGTPNGVIRAPTVIVLARFSRVPMKRPKFSARNLWERDGGRCQYTGRALAPGEGNIDHVLPRSRGGATTWENCVISDKRVNTKKGDKTPQEAGLRLLKKPEAPREMPVTMMLKNNRGITDWEVFLGCSSSSD